MVRPIIVPQNDITNYYLPTNNYRIGRVEPPCGMENPKRVSFFSFTEIHFYISKLQVCT